MTDCAPFTWTVVIPVKVLARAKSRLAALAGSRRAEMALAFACDTVSAVLAVPTVARVVVVTADSVAARELATLGAVIAQDTTTDLNDALHLGASTFSAAASKGTGDTPVPIEGPRCITGALGIAALTADLPALRPGELARALGRVRRGAAFVPDAHDVGTTLYAAPPNVLFRPMYGGRSRERHARHGAAELRLDDVPGLRRDVDTPEDLAAAAVLGLGPRTAPIAHDLLRYARPDRSASA
jgi:2-phospho-L-lactate/phosphoenolpyruvate guanylyltransferase